MEIPFIPKTKKGLKFQTAAEELNIISDEFFELRNHNPQYINALENILRGAVGLYKPLILVDAPPGAVSPIIGLVTLVVFFTSIRENN